MEYPSFVKQYKPKGTIVKNKEKPIMFMKQLQLEFQTKNILKK